MFEPSDIKLKNNNCLVYIAVPTVPIYKFPFQAFDVEFISVFRYFVCYKYLVSDVQEKLFQCPVTIHCHGTLAFAIIDVVRIKE
jgi:hypothetical protein